MTSPPLQRMRGRAGVVIGSGGLRDLHQSGAAKAMLPRVHDAVPEVVFLNTAGGVTNGDDLRYSLDLAAGARAVATTQTAERAYAALPGTPARVTVTLALGRGAALDWLPQETILFDRAALTRETDVRLGSDARILMAEMLVMGRAAMGEQVTRLSLADRRRVTRDGRPVLWDAQICDDGALSGDGPVALDGGRATAFVALVAPGAEDAVIALADHCGPREDGTRLEVSGWDGRCLIRAVAADAAPLKRRIAQVLGQLRAGSVPRVWQT